MILGLQCGCGMPCDDACDFPVCRFCRWLEANPLAPELLQAEAFNRWCCDDGCLPRMHRGQVVYWSQCL
jgi:hypothetical protein